jgi:hypothetical protein
MEKVLQHRKGAANQEVNSWLGFAQKVFDCIATPTRLFTFCAKTPGC